MRSALIAVAFCGAAGALRCGPAAHLSRRDALVAAAGLLSAGAPTRASADVAPAERPSWDPRKDYLVGAEKNAISDYEVVASQQATGGLIDVNSALVTDYKRLRGMYPHAAGQITSHGPYASLAELNAIPTATANDKALFRRYRKELTVLPPRRMLNERINARQST